jgi:glycosyl transferase, family 25
MISKYQKDSSAQIVSEHQKNLVSVPVHVLNLKRSEMRRESFKTTNVHLEYSFYEAVDGSKLEQQEIAEHFSDFLPFPSRGAYGAALSHLKMWELVIEKGMPMTVAEDDAIFRDDFHAMSEAMLSRLPSNWDIVLWGWNFDSILSINTMAAPMVVSSDQDVMRANARVFQSERTEPAILKLDKCFGLPAYTISPKGARLFKRSCFPMKNFRLKFPTVSDEYPNTGIDIAMNRVYSSSHSYVSFPPLVITKNQHEISTIQSGISDS